MQLAVNQTRQPVRILLEERFAPNPDKEVKRSILSSFHVSGGNGKGKVYRFRDANGQEFAPALTNKLATTFRLGVGDPFFEENLAAFQAYHETCDRNVKIYDPAQETRAEIADFEQQLSAGNKIGDLVREGKIETMVDMLRRIDGYVNSDATAQDIQARLLRIAKDTPKRILDLATDVNYEAKVAIDRAVDSTRLVLQEGRFYKLKDGRLIADGIDDMVRKYTFDPSIKAYVDDSVVPQSVLGLNESTTTVEDAPDWRDMGEETDVNPDLPKPEGAPKSEFTEDELRAIVEASMDSGFYVKDATGAYVFPGQTMVTTVEQGMDLFRTNPDLARAQKNEMITLGVPIG